MDIVMQKVLKKAKLLLFPPVLSQEAFDAYFFKLPDTIEVNWKRDGDFIIGKVVAGNNKFTTQGKSPEDFMEMVNDAIYTVFDIPLEYINEIKKVRTYNPPQEAIDQLKNLSIQGNTLSLSKNTNSSMRIA
jgi:hypothetical protein